MDYSVRDSSIIPDNYSTQAYNDKDNSIRVGIVREERMLKDDETRYIVEVSMDGRQVPVSCTLMTRWGGVYNFEEYRVRPWGKIKTPVMAPGTAGKYTYRSGDTVVVAFLNGNSREGVILGGLRHPGRDEETTEGNIEYLSRFNGLETQIRTDGSYKVLFKGAPINETLLDIPLGAPIMSPVYNPLTSGSYFGFSSNGSFVVTDSKQFIKIDKNIASGAIIIKSGKNTLELGGNIAIGTTTIQTDNIVMEATMNASMKANLDMNFQSTKSISMKALQVAIGNDQIELVDGLVQLIDALGGLVVTSPVGTCTPLMAAPTWASAVVPLKIKLSILKGSLADAPTAEFSGDDEIDIGDDIGS